MTMIHDNMQPSLRTGKHNENEQGISSTDDMTKNATRISSLLGTWTTYADVQASLGLYRVKAYFVVHFMADPMSQYACQLDKCSEWENQICQKEEPQRYSNKTWHEVTECRNMTDIVSDWSDVAAFYTVGIEIHAGVPFRVHKVMDSGGWIGPFNLVLAQDKVMTEEPRQQQQDGSSSERIVDRYRVRYVETPSTRLLARKPINDTLFRGGVEFDAVMGEKAVNTTRWVQAKLDDKNSSIVDPYARYKKTCKNGDIQPILPLYGFDFVETTETEPDDESDDPNQNTTITTKEEIRVQVDYQLVLAPQTHTKAYSLMKWIQSSINAESKRLGFSFQGPFCYGGNPDRAWTIAVHMNSSKVPMLQQSTATPLQLADAASSSSTSAVQIHRGCIAGFPCLPPAAANDNRNHNQHSPDNDSGDPSATVVWDVDKFLWQLGFWSMFIVWLVTLCIMNRQRKRRSLSSSGLQHNGNVLDESSSTPPLTTPLLSSSSLAETEEEQEVESEERQEGEHDEEEARNSARLSNGKSLPATLADEPVPNQPPSTDCNGEPASRLSENEAGYPPMATQDPTPLSEALPSSSNKTPPAAFPRMSIQQPNS